MKIVILGHMVYINKTAHCGPKLCIVCNTKSTKQVVSEHIFTHEKKKKQQLKNQSDNMDQIYNFRQNCENDLSTD